MSDYRKSLIRAATMRPPVLLAVLSNHDNVECVATGRVQRVDRSHVMLVSPENHETSRVPIASITAVHVLQHDHVEAVHLAALQHELACDAGRE